MNKSQGATAGAVMVLAAGAFLRPSSTSAPLPALPSALAQAPASGSPPAEPNADGPWKASCQYWAPVRVPGKDAQEPAAKVPVSVVAHGTKPDSSLETPGASEHTCAGTTLAWGIPPRLAGTSLPEITSLVAVVPDPERGNLNLDFDRTVDALLQAASDNGYVGSYFWLPWNTAATRDAKGMSATAESSAESPSQPGLIILKPGGAVDRSDKEQNYRRAVYVFLVAATPTQGVAGEQLRNAFAYEAELLNLPNARTTLSLRDWRDPATAGPAPATQPGASPAQAADAARQAQAERRHLEEMDVLLFNYSGSAASFREGLVTALRPAERESSLSRYGIKTVSVAGATSTELVGDLLDGNVFGTNIRFHSFEQDTNIEEAEVTNVFQDERRSCDSIAFVAEDGTVFGSSASRDFAENPSYKSGSLGSASKTRSRILAVCGSSEPLILKFPRGISLLRNATARESEKGAQQSDATTSPYLHFSLRDANAEDSVPHFAADDTPLSQEAQLMAIGRRLSQSHVRTIAISSSSILDELYLAQFLHRACPDARLVFLGGGDLLVERDIENAQYLGAITFSPYSLINLDHNFFTPRDVRAFASAQSEAFYNAASYLFWDPSTHLPRLAGYPLHQYGDASRNVLRPILWATAVGRDGYYPLGILNPCASSTEATLPDIAQHGDGTKPITSACNPTDPGDSPSPFEPAARVYPSLAWFILCVGTALLCIGHSAILLIANFWSPVTRDLAIECSDMPRRRAVYVNIASAMLFCMAFVVAYPLVPVFCRSTPSFNAAIWAILTLAAALFSLLVTARRTYRHIGPDSNELETPEMTDRCQPSDDRQRVQRKNYYVLLHIIAGLTVVVVPTFWVILCETNHTLGTHTFAGLFFSYRCLHPESGVSPLPPIVLLLFGWYLWGLCQTLRLRFSVNSRPQLPCRLPASTAYPLYVAEEDLSRCETSQSPCLHRNITCLLITREVMRRLFLAGGARLDAALVVGYFGLFAIAVLLVHVQSLDHFLWNAGFWPTFYEFLIRGLFFPLMMIALTGWIRVILVWSSLRRGLLEPLERLPIRYAFNRLKGVAWMSMLRQGGLTEYWRDMARSTESMRQMVHTADLESAIKPENPRDWTALVEANAALGEHIRELHSLIRDKTPDVNRGGQRVRKQSREFLVGDDLPAPRYRDELNLMAGIERGYARFCELLLDSVLIPYWNKKRTGLVEGEPPEMMPVKAKGGAEESAETLEPPAPPHDPDEECIRLAEEFLAIRYVSLVRGVLVNLRYTMIFVSMAFVVSLLAWNAYPFRPRVWVDWMFTAVLLVLGAGVVTVLAQMYRNPILSRITDTAANELGVEFYIRLATLGGVPVLTWLASQFPVLGNSLFHFLKPGLDFAK